MSLKSTENFAQLAKSLSQITVRLQSNLEEPFRETHFADLFARRASLLIGPRGIGKTTYLLRRSQQEKRKS